MEMRSMRSHLVNVEMTVTEPGDITFDDDGKPVPAVTDAAAPVAEPESVLATGLRFAIEGRTLADVGRRALLVAHLCKISGCGTQTELAERIGVTPPAVSQALTLLKLELADLVDL